MTRMLSLRPLTKEAFLPFGEVIETDGAEERPINQGTTIRYHDLARVDVAGANGHPLISIFRGQPFAFPVAIGMMERHPLGSQSFFPLDGRPYLVVVAADQGGTPGEPVVFLAVGRQGVNYAAGTWHHPLLALEAESDFLVVDRGGDGVNLEEFAYDEPYMVAS